MTRFSGLLRGESGTAAAELALCLPMVMALMFGSFEAGNYMLTEHKVIKGVRDGARYAARLPFANFDCATGEVADSDVEDDSTAAVEVHPQRVQGLLGIALHQITHVHFEIAP